MKKQIILFKTHFVNKSILNEFNRLEKVCNDLNYDIFLLYDNSKNDFDIKIENVFLFIILNNIDIRKID